MSFGPRAEKFKIASNDHGRTHKCDFPFPTGDTLFGQTWSKKLKLTVEAEFGTETNSNNIHNSMVAFTFFVSGRKYSFWANLVQKIKIVKLS